MLARHRASSLFLFVHPSSAVTIGKIRCGCFLILSTRNRSLSLFCERRVAYIDSVGTAVYSLIVLQ